ncbi:MAG: ABC transporter permease [Planctomycetaceae bacterium]|nr:ABC transporter permease [Planctomycetaceae bacterium]
MPLWKIAWRSIQHRSLASSLTAFSMSLGVALIVTVIVIYGVLDQSFRRSAQGYDLIVGPKGSSLELVISTVFYQREPIGKIPYEYLTELRSGRYRSVVEAAIPVALGEHYRGLPVVATSSEFFTRLEYLDGRKYQFQSGKNFSDGNYFDAVIGYSAARKTGLKVGDKFKTMHGKDISDEHQTEYTVVGVLKPTGTPNDGAIFINVEGFFDMHAGQENVLDASLTLKTQKTEVKADDQDHVHDENCDHDHAEEEQADDHVHDESCGHDHAKSLSAILVLTKEEKTTATAREGLFGDIQEIDGGKSVTRQIMTTGVMALPGRIENDLNAQAVRPTEVIAFLFEKIIGNVQLVLLILAALVVVVAGIGMMVSIYNSMNERRQEIAIMRALGARRTTVMAIILLESILLSLGGGAFGVFLGHSLILVLGPWISGATGIIVSAWHFQWAELILIPGLIALASVVGYLPAVIAYRTDVAQSLHG